MRPSNVASTIHQIVVTTTILVTGVTIAGAALAGSVLYAAARTNPGEKSTFFPAALSVLNDEAGRISMASLRTAATIAEITAAADSCNAPDMSDAAHKSWQGTPRQRRAVAPTINPASLPRRFGLARE